ncbi:APC family permease [Microbacterium sp. NPDC077663]|uniref:APC family permease n=1 Tax=Microbacterium sp. NPDC077663 TaxID=3364189 RepID=UPI0037CA2C74
MSATRSAAEPSTGTSLQGAEPELAKGKISAGQALFFGLTALGIASVISGFGATLVVASGNSSWLAMIIGAVVVFLLGFIVVRFSKRHLTTGSIMSYLDLEIGPRAGVLGGAALFVGYIAVMILFVGLSLIFLVSFLGGFGIDMSSTPLQALLGAVLVAGCVLLARCGVTVSVNTSIVLGWICVPFAIFILIAAVVHSGIDFTAQLSLEGFSLETFIPGFILAYGAFAGFEGFTALAQETADPRRTIPKIVMSIIAVIAGVGIVSVFLTVPIMTANIDQVLAGASPLYLLSQVGQVGGLGTFTDALMFLASVGSLLAYITDAGRIFGTAGRDGILPKSLGHIHEKHRTPARAIAFVGTSGMLVFVAYLLITGEPIYLAFVNFALVTSYSWSVAYLALTWAGVVDGVRTRSPWFTTGSMIAGLVVLFALVMSVVSGNIAVPIVTLAVIAALWIAGIVSRRSVRVTEASETL